MWVKRVCLSSVVIALGFWIYSVSPVSDTYFFETIREIDKTLIKCDDLAYSSDAEPQVVGITQDYCYDLTELRNKVVKVNDHTRESFDTMIDINEDLKVFLQQLEDSR